MEQDRTPTVAEYEKPLIVDYGDLRDLTQAANVGTTLDGHFTHVREVQVSP